MARTIKVDEREAKRTEILDAAQRLVSTKGYERMTIQDILGQLQISSGAFYHYFASKPEILEALVDRIKDNSAAQLRRVVDDPSLSAAQKLRAFFDTLDQLRVQQQATVLAILPIWYGDSNAIVRQKVEAATTAWRAPLIAEIARQGVREGTFTTEFPDQAGELVLALTTALAVAHAALMLAFPENQDEHRFTIEVMARHAACVDAIERVLGAPIGTLRRAHRDEVKLWADAMLGRPSKPARQKPQKSRRSTS